MCEPLLTHRNETTMASKLGSVGGPGTKARCGGPSVGELPVCGPGGARCIGGVSSSQALAWNRRTCRPDRDGRRCWPREGEPQAARHCEWESTDAGHRGGPARSSGEGPVMGPERRGRAVHGRLEVNPSGEEPTDRPRQKNAGLWEPYDGRLSRTVLREREGEVPSRHSPPSHHLNEDQPNHCDNASRLPSTRSPDSKPTTTSSENTSPSTSATGAKTASPPRQRHVSHMKPKLRTTTASSPPDNSQQPAPSAAAHRPRVHQPSQLRSPRTADNMTRQPVPATLHPMFTRRANQQQPAHTPPPDHHHGRCHHHRGATTGPRESAKRERAPAALIPAVRTEGATP